MTAALRKIETKSASEDTGIEEVKAALEALTSDIEQKTAPVADLTERLAKLEAKANRLHAPANENKEPSEEKKAFNFYLRRGTVAPDELKALTVSTDTAGGYLVPQDFVAELLRNVVQFSPVRRYARVMTTGTASVVIPKRTGTITAHWVGEIEDRTESEPTFGQVELTPFEAATYVDVSNQLLEDSAIDLTSELALEGAEEFGRLEGAAFVSGDGEGKPKGILTDSDIDVIEAGSDEFLGDALIDAFYSLPAFYRANTTWGMNSKTLATVRKLKDGNGAYIWQPGLQAGEPSTLLGRPVAELPDMPDIGADTTPIVFGDFNQGYRIVDRVSLSILRDPYSIATKGQTRFHMRRRVGGGVTKAEALKLISIAPAG